MNTFIHVIWKENTKYRVFSDLHRIYVVKIFRTEPFQEKVEAYQKKKLTFI